MRGFNVAVYMEVLPFIYLLFIGLLADVIGSFRRIGRIGAFIILALFTPMLGIPILLLFPLTIFYYR
jgi:hypothetical protein